MKKGFTLIEMVGVLVILSLLVAFTFPVVINVIKDKKSDAESFENQMIENAAKLYIKDNNLEGENLCINISDLQKGKYLKDVSEVKTKVKVTYTGGVAEYIISNSCS